MLLSHRLIALAVVVAAMAVPAAWRRLLEAGRA
jgi:hypothetical protein